MTDTISPDDLVDIAIAAGDAILAIYDSDEFEVRQKDDDSPLTAADLAANQIIVRRLEDLTPETPILSEESMEVPYEERSTWQRFWLIDPLDGTKEFIKRNGEFTVNIALIDSGQPVFGVVHAPAIGVTFVGGPGLSSQRIDAGGRERIHVATDIDGAVRIAVSRSHLRDADHEFIESMTKIYGEVETIPTGSSLKLCLVADGSVDVYPRFGPTSEWDTAAAHAVLIGAGGLIETTDGGELRYNKRELLNPYFVARTPAIAM